MSGLQFVCTLFVSVVVLVIGCKKADDNPKVVRREGNPDVVNAEETQTMLRAKQRAKDTHKDFIAALESRKPSQMGFSVKKRFVTLSGDEEHIWISEPTWNGKAFVGVLGNEPLHVKGVAVGDTVVVELDDMSDWMYLDGPRLVGGYTIRAIYHDSSEEERAEMRKRVPFEIPAVDF